MEGLRRQRRFARFSDPYRFDEMVVVVPRHNPGRWRSLADPAALRRALEIDRRARVGVLRGWAYGRLLQAWLEDPAQADRVVRFASPAELLAAVSRGRVALGLAERVTVAHLTWPAPETYPLLSVLTAGGGMLMREFIRGRGEGLLQRGVLYHEITFGGSLLLSLFLVGYSGRQTYRVEDLELAVILTMAPVMVIRLTAIERGWRSPALGADRLRRATPLSDPEPPADPPDRESRCS